MKLEELRKIGSFADFSDIDTISVISAHWGALLDCVEAAKDMYDGVMKEDWPIHKQQQMLQALKKLEFIE